MINLLGVFLGSPFSSLIILISPCLFIAFLILFIKHALPIVLEKLLFLFWLSFLLSSLTLLSLPSSNYSLESISSSSSVLITFSLNSICWVLINFSFTYFIAVSCYSSSVSSSKKTILLLWSRRCLRLLVLFFVLALLVNILLYACYSCHSFSSIKRQLLSC